MKHFLTVELLEPGLSLIFGDEKKMGIGSPHNLHVQEKIHLLKYDNFHSYKSMIYSYSICFHNYFEIVSIGNKIKLIINFTIEGAKRHT